MIRDQITSVGTHSLAADALVVGLQDLPARYCQLNPPPDRVVLPGENLVLLRSGR